MCGIAGIYDSMGARPVDRDILEKMIGELAHRGPDDEGIFLKDGVGLAHKRLSIIDLDGGHQPMHANDDQVTLVFNGMIYNYKALKTRLRGAGHSFRTESDTEVLIAAYKAWGTDMCKYLDGFFAFAIYDHNHEMLFAARDVFGKKPFYYYLDKEFYFHFASELPALMHCFKGKPSLSARAIDNFFAMGFIPDTKSLYDNVFKLPPGHKLTFRRSYDQPKIEPFMNLKPVEIEGDDTVLPTYDEAKERLNHLMHEAVEKRLIADVPIGILLSGGVDSAAITYYARKHHKDIKTFTAGFKDEALDEREHAREIAEHFGTDHTELLIDIDGENIIDDIATVAGEPFADASLIPTYLICKHAKEHATVLLSGDGADEMFFGYDRYASFSAQERLKSYLSLETRKIMFGWLGDRYPQNNYIPRWARAGATLEAIADDRAGGYLRNFGITRQVTRSDLYSSDFKDILDKYDSKFFLKKQFDLAKHLKDPMKQAQFVDLNIWLAGRMLVKADRASMSAQIELRAPFLDKALCEFLFTLPYSYFQRDGRAKILLRDLIRPFLPDDYLNRPKRGFVFPLAEMLRTKWSERMHTVINDPVLEQMGIFNHSVLRKIYREHCSKRHDHSRLLWAILQLDAFFNTTRHIV
ncbi:MAG: asparagine synthase (glutamine-hydrolyzing) [Pseudomonadota bacterium]